MCNLGGRLGNVAVITLRLLSFRKTSSIGLNPSDHGWSNTLSYFNSSTLSLTNGCASTPSPNSMWKKTFPKTLTPLIEGMFSIAANWSMSRTMPQLGLPANWGLSGVMRADSKFVELDLREKSRVWLPQFLLRCVR